MKRSKAQETGLTLVELLIALGLSGAVMLVLAQAIIAFNQSNIGNQKLTHFLEEKTNLELALRYYFRRATAIAFTQNPADAASPGFVISKNGAVAFLADLRDCNSFHPATSSANLSSIKILCCNPGLALSVRLPTSPPTNETSGSACTQTPGLSLEVRKAGALVSKTCYSDYVEAKASVLGRDFAHGSDFVNLDFKSRMGALGGSGQTIPGTEKSLRLIDSIQNTLQAAVIDCHESIPKSF